MEAFSDSLGGLKAPPPPPHLTSRSLQLQWKGKTGLYVGECQNRGNWTPSRRSRGWVSGCQGDPTGLPIHVSSAPPSA